MLATDKTGKSIFSPCPCYFVSELSHPLGWSVPVYFSLLPYLLLWRHDLMSITIPHCQCKLLFSYLQIYPKANNKLLIINDWGIFLSYKDVLWRKFWPQESQCIKNHNISITNWDIINRKHILIDREPKLGYRKQIPESVLMPVGIYKWLVLCLVQKEE